MSAFALEDGFQHFRADVARATLGCDLVPETGLWRVLGDCLHPACPVAVLGLEAADGPVRRLSVILSEKLLDRLIRGVGHGRPRIRREHQRQYHRGQAAAMGT
jgi:hypothetical protein